MTNDPPLGALHVIVPEPAGSIGGADMHVRDLASAQARSGRTTPAVFETLSPAFARRVREAGVDCVSTAGRGKGATLRTLRRLITSGRFDVIHAHGYDGTWWALAALATVRPRPHLVVTCHGWIENSHRLRLMSKADRAANRLAAGVIAVSDELVPAALECATRATAFAMIPNGVPIIPVQAESTIRADLRLPAAAPLVGAMGRLSAEKRHDLFVEACALIARVYPNAHYVLAGGGLLEEQLVQHAAAAGLADRFHMVGVVDDPAALLAQLAVLIQPSDVETTSKVVLEAMVQARPIVATRVGGMETMIQHDHNGILVDSGSAEPLASAALRLLDDRTMAACLGHAARRTALERFRIDDMAAAVDDVYAAVVGRASMRPQTWVRASEQQRKGRSNGTVHNFRPNRDRQWPCRRRCSAGGN